MNFKESILSFIHDKDYYICSYEQKIYIYKYNKIQSFNKNNFIIETKNKLIYIYGKNLKIEKLTRNELLIDGILTNIKLEDKNENKSSN